MAISTRNEGSKVNANINVTPMVDVMLVLLIIFMVITPMLQKGVSVDLAKVKRLIGSDYAGRKSIFRQRPDCSRPAHEQGQRPTRQ